MHLVVWELGVGVYEGGGTDFPQADARGYNYCAPLVLSIFL